MWKKEKEQGVSVSERFVAVTGTRTWVYESNGPRKDHVLAPMRGETQGSRACDNEEWVQAGLA